MKSSKSKGNNSTRTSQSNSSEFEPTKTTTPRNPHVLKSLSSNAQSSGRTTTIVKSKLPSSSTTSKPKRKSKKRQQQREKEKETTRRDHNQPRSLKPKVFTDDRLKKQTTSKKDSKKISFQETVTPRRSAVQKRDDCDDDDTLDLTASPSSSSTFDASLMSDGEDTLGTELYFPRAPSVQGKSAFARAGANISRCFGDIKEEISGTYADTMQSMDQVCSAFTLTEKDITAVSKKIEKAKRQLDR